MKKEVFILEAEDSKYKRIYELVSLIHSLGAYHKDSWGKLFKTKSYKKSLKTQVKIKEHIRYHIEKAFPYADKYSFEFLGSHNLYDVQLRRHQRYLLIIKTEEN